MESTTWVLSPNTNQTTAGNTPTPGKSPYYPSQEYTPTGGVQSSNPASGSGSNSMQFGPPSQQPTPQAMHHVATPSNFTDSEQMFLHQFEQNLYEEAQQQGHHLSNGESPRNTPGAYPDNIPQTHHHSGSTPGHSHPTSIPIPPPQYEFGLDQMTFIIPDDMSFDDNHHSNHIPHQGSSSAYPPQQPQQPTPSMMPANKRESDSMFSPVLPGQNERSYNNQHYFHRQNSSNKIFTQSSQPQQQQHVRPDAVFTPLVSPAGTPLEKPYRAPVQVTFEPLTSPALNAQPSFSTTNSTTSTATAGSSTTATSTGTTDKRKYEDSGSTSTYKRRTPHGTPILAANNKSSYSPPASKPRNGMSLPESAIKEETSMLPPVGGKPMLNTNSSSNSLNNGSAPLMGFTMGRLAEEQGKPPQTTQRRTSSMSRKSSTSSSDSASSSKKEKPATKKASHKLAEQGRRNRMNMAVHELGSLIPQSYHDEVSIPSKATTVELASKYITALLKELEELKQNK
ncbi:uncharacterized protein SPAPADRAFT_58927 [Spathaspora passalidarum NRRL Y-27907]|uniref:BHLH domain-containing protein n=1 Tax=Spathaspora passalidarum (strain NRRL Y-27907 / 11-Y1) TaxID=619300 RepID=G3AEE2_SPAPN|nr:uncharacterized protein SPAPADRAFT_58927 [Spathaspora passalidarum NRRL Y-27907]EGW35730.1 hypothetical protein SPAPADRAFT_58927 [Spathaspora passalidarum NRRL Y-27907]